MTECPKCEGFGSVCLECRQVIDDCGCGEDSKPYVCAICDGRGKIAAPLEFIRPICAYPDCKDDCPGRTREVAV